MYKQEYEMDMNTTYGTSKYMPKFSLKPKGNIQLEGPGYTHEDNIKVVLDK
jgi:hypothetical protein